MITVIKQDPRGKVKIRYEGEVLRRSADEIVIEAYWTLPKKDLGYTCFEPGDRFIEYYWTKHWFNIFDITSPDGIRKGWYCNITEPARIDGDQIEQIDLLLDVWVNPQGETLILDEDEFAADPMLSQRQRNGAQQGLQALIELLAQRVGTFAVLANHQ